METIHFHYESYPRCGRVNISASYGKTCHFQRELPPFQKTYTIQSDFTPRQLLERLEESIAEQSNESATFRDLCRKNDDEYPEAPRYFGYLATASLGGKFAYENTPEEQIEIDKRNKERHGKIFPICQRFIANQEAKQKTKYLLTIKP